MAEINDSSSVNADPKKRVFSASEMVGCSRCSRANPPTRASCLYCGTALETTESNIQAQEAPASESRIEKAFHVVALRAQVDEAILAKATTLSDLKPAELNLILRSAKGAPIYSAADSARAEMVSTRLRDLGIETITISDEQLDLASASKDLRALEFAGDSLSGFVRRGGARLSASWAEVTLIVLGRLHVTTVEIEQKTKRGRSRLLNELELSADESVLDIYVRNEPAAWRIRSGSFDFSCLGDRKAITAFENFRALIELLRQRAGHADFDDSHVRVKSVLAKIWPAEEQARTRERRRTAIRTFEASATSSDNEAQFNRYSRLLSVLKKRELGDNP